MNAKKADYDQLQQDAAIVPGELVKAMAERDGEGEGGLTLSREHIITINRYVNFVFALPATSDNLQRWLGYTDIDEPELKPAAWSTLFADLRSHARSWAPLSDNSKRLASQLATTANSISSAGEAIIELTAEVLKLDRESQWQELALRDPLPLGVSDRGSVSTLLEYMQFLNEDVRAYAVQVAAVKEETESFRDIARFKLIPAVKTKGQAVERKQNDGEVERLRGLLAQLDADIEALSKEYDQYVKMALSGLAAGPIGALITGGIYGSKAEKVRKERQTRQAERRSFSEQLTLRVNLEGRMETLSTAISELDTRLQDVVTSASHLQTAWGIVGAYIDTSISRLERIDDTQRLALFGLHFKQFFKQWAAIEKTSLHLTRIFDEAASAQ
ncbi:alpha-xenorhabdolysin family binary toxin subunit A [Pseudomonas sichuanensis]|uniref:alpha-xenorhabdolysin family binary toxin subunit A n=1 Tax=Pseudomonas sichuanensis TaxID=2213015 RepID=UPI00244877CE|nr:alpha-xenorhabdolysin family binary toxin subunit A [Pseudomonas sichuanensis]MDH0732826.1 alpha-xenorhabdolysin family binary toxin subunit A [Pseudomonas sichuanensis]MDH1584689.1 alpha-xenorhabdolysin family binary toxin subunit A [Pseudomonas sichuanensis]MDH1593189.1 alpha-xenorhabdolysin family binary toxin subunit A [Pseudomonas sichuanensis]MDH1600303.1 alpha-xenorhabdolysin family binary toxin subunit A [Pseudomonas sichuanensis]